MRPAMPSAMQSEHHQQDNHDDEQARRSADRSRSAAEAVLTLVLVVGFGVGWAHLEIVRRPAPIPDDFRNAGLRPPLDSRSDGVIAENEYAVAPAVGSTKPAPQRGSAPCPWPNP